MNNDKTTRGVLEEFGKKYTDPRDLKDVSLGGGANIYIVWYSEKANKAFYFICIQKTLPAVIAKYKSDTRSNKVTLSAELLTAYKEYQDLDIYVVVLNIYKLREFTNTLSRNETSWINIKKSDKVKTPGLCCVYMLKHISTGYFYLTYSSVTYADSSIKKMMLTNVSTTINKTLKLMEKGSSRGDDHPHTVFINQMRPIRVLDLMTDNQWSISMVVDEVAKATIDTTVEELKNKYNKDMCLNIIDTAMKTNKNNFVSKLQSYKKNYPDVNAEELDEAGDYFTRHMTAMAVENLHSKYDIAIQLGWRDMEIDKLKKQVTESEE